MRIIACTLLTGIMLCLSFTHAVSWAAPEEVLVDLPVMESTEDTTTGWLAVAGGSSGETINALIPLGNGGMLAVGSFEQNINFNGNVIGYSSNDSVFGEDMFLGWIAENGSWVQTSSASSTGLDSITHAAQLSDGSIVVAGIFCGMTLGDECNLTLGELDPLNKTQIGHDDAVFLAAIHPDGTWMWVKQFSNEFQTVVTDLMVTEMDEIHLAVLHRGELISGNTSSAGSPTEEQIALIGMNSFGQHLFMHSVLSPQAIEDATALCEDGYGNRYIAITFLEAIIFGTEETDSTLNDGANVGIGQYDNNGWVWSAAAMGPADAMVADCQGLQAGGMVVVGDYLSNMTFGELELQDAVWVDFFEAQISPTGSWVDVNGYGGNGADHITALQVSDQGDSLLLGKTTGSITFGEFVLSDIDGVNDGNHHDIFLAKHQPDGSWDWAVSAGGSGNDLPGVLSMNSNGSPVIGFKSNADATYGNHHFDQRNSYDIGIWMYETDLDADGILDGIDNCPKIPNTDQLNFDGDPFGDICDEDDDEDGVLDGADECPYGDIGWGANAFTDHDGDGCRDLTEDFDDDEDGVFDTEDLCPRGPLGWVSTSENDIEGDGCSDKDNDGDGFVDQQDNCPDMANPTQTDLDGDGIGDACDLDKDGDGIDVPVDQCPHDINPWQSDLSNDYDQDGCLDATMDEDDDGDGVDDAVDSCLLGEKGWAANATEVDHDGDGCFDETEDNDDDADGVLDINDRCPRGFIGVAQTGQDADADGCIDAVEDDDDDQDGVLDPLDSCPNSDPANQINLNGCSQFQLDGDGDGVFNAFDFCLNTPSNAIVDQQGCQTGTITPSSQDDDGGFGLAGYIFILAGLVLIWAFVSSNRRAGPRLPPANQGMLPPKTTARIPQSEE
ncbi:MAG: thrombospondin type 3 repeat-containing protein [Candidatus Poseidonia sp.]|nr:thrombospondin type 3 repeat-containing protein [Poseidonia sp.]MBL6807044.1 thrombospondin type 3 repeat-containing protein [Poseidonia sp.]MBL6892985.1 thrombospondin type 3 repeat-containing protein [Poseidonia sp.]